MNDRVPPLRVKAVRQKASSIWALLLIFLFFMGFMFVLLLRSPLGKIEQIVIEGNQLVPQKEISSKLGTKVGGSYFAFRPQDAQKAIANIPEIKRVEVHRSFPSKITVTLQEQRMVAFVRTEDGAVLPLLENGKIMTQRNTVSMLQQAPIFEKWDLNSEVFRQAVEMFSRCSFSDFKEITYIYPVEGYPDQMVLHSKMGHNIYVRIEDLPEKMKLYSSFHNQPSGALYLLESVWFTPGTIHESQ
ncbi:cell division protein FtsQ/DivIB [Baia soyae]|uniref:Cell division septal protein FtsQ n=1 Tax=Baia soyae TaxID=1544746 RepID=A0A4R2S3B9_9BACL|nr:FtsQ-type POTRA domain-containing protein [Baia soyae]TCP70424.1 cell division septal protein FtsQ [Baia soyae]